MRHHGVDNLTYAWIKCLGRNGANTDRNSVLHNDFVDFGVTDEMEIGVHCSSRVDVGVGGVATTTSLGIVRWIYLDEVFLHCTYISVDPFEPMLCTTI